MAREKISLLGVMVFVIAIIYWAAQNPQQAVRTGEDVKHAGELFLDEVCPLPEKVLASIDENFVQSLPEGKAKELAKKILNNTATNCDKRMLFDLLDEEQRKKINWLEFVCNVKDCIEK